MKFDRGGTLVSLYRTFYPNQPTPHACDRDAGDLGETLRRVLCAAISVMNVINFGAQATIFRPRDQPLDYLSYGNLVPSGRGNPSSTRNAPQEAFTKRRGTERPTTSIRDRIEVVLPAASR